MQGNTLRQSSLGFNLPCCGFQVPGSHEVLDSGFFVSGTWIPDSNHLWGSGSLSCILARVQNSFIIHKQKTKEINV